MTTTDQKRDALEELKRSWSNAGRIDIGDELDLIVRAIMPVMCALYAKAEDEGPLDAAEIEAVDFLFSVLERMAPSSLAAAIAQFDGPLPRHLKLVRTNEDNRPSDSE